MSEPNPYRAFRQFERQLQLARESRFEGEPAYPIDHNSCELIATIIYERQPDGSITQSIESPKKSE